MERSFLEWVQMVTRNGALADIFPQQAARAWGTTGAWMERFHVNTIRGPQRGPCVFLATGGDIRWALLLLMVVRGRRAEPAARRCSVTGKALFISQHSNLSSSKQSRRSSHNRGAQAWAAWYSKENQVLLMCLSSNPRTDTYRDVKLGRSLHFSEP